jgi:hypothetical protein
LSAIAMSPQAGTVDPAQLPKVALLRTNVRSIDVSVGAAIFLDAAPAAHVKADVGQLVSLLLSKLDILSNWYKSKLASQDAAMRRAIQTHQANRAKQLVSQSVKQNQALVDLYDTHLRDKCYIAFRFLRQQSQALSYLTLKHDTAFESTMARLRQNRMSIRQYHSLLKKTYLSLLRRWSDTAAGTNNCGGHCWSSVDYSLATLSQGATFSASGHATIAIDMPVNVGYSHVTFSDVRVFLLGVDGQAQSTVTVNFFKVGESLFLDSQGQRWTFTHQATKPAFGFSYDVASCQLTESVVKAADGSNICNTNSLYMKYSPYGVWKIQVRGSKQGLSSVTGIRFAFQLSLKTRQTQSTILFDSAGPSGCMTKPHATQCGAKSTVPAPPAAGLAPVLSKPSKCTACSTMPAFTNCVNAVTHQCCDEPSEHCTNGQPSTCNADCAVELRAMMTTCKQFLAAPFMATVRKPLQAALAKCPQPGKPCITYADFTAYETKVQHACCHGQQKCSVSGLPQKGCSTRCAAVLPAMNVACSRFLQQSPVFKPVADELAAASARCTAGGH